MPAAPTRIRASAPGNTSAVPTIRPPTPIPPIRPRACRSIFMGVTPSVSLKPTAAAALPIRFRCPSINNPPPMPAPTTRSAEAKPPPCPPPPSLTWPAAMSTTVPGSGIMSAVRMPPRPSPTRRTRTPVSPWIITAFTNSVTPRPTAPAVTPTSSRSPFTRLPRPMPAPTSPFAAA